jgi:hypothetical protein
MIGVQKHPPPTVLNVENTVFIRERIRRIDEDIAAAESKIERIRNRIERDRHALLLWQERLAGIPYERPNRQ